MLIFAIDYNEQGIGHITGSLTQETLDKKPPTEGYTRALVRSEEEMAALDPKLILWIANFKSGKTLSELPPVPEVWAMLSQPKKKNIEKNPNEGLQQDGQSATSGPPEGVVPQKKGRKANMAKAKKKAAKKTAKREKGALPGPDTKAGKLLALILRAGGATFKEMQKVTGWKEMRGTASVLAVRAGKKLTIIKAEGKETRWQAK